MSTEAQRAPVPPRPTAPPPPNPTTRLPDQPPSTTAASAPASTTAASGDGGTAPGPAGCTSSAGTSSAGTSSAGTTSAGTSSAPSFSAPVSSSGTPSIPGPGSGSATDATRSPGTGHLAASQDPGHDAGHDPVYEPAAWEPPTAPADAAPQPSADRPGNTGHGDGGPARSRQGGGPVRQGDGGPVRPGGGSPARQGDGGPARSRQGGGSPVRHGDGGPARQGDGGPVRRDDGAAAPVPSVPPPPQAPPLPAVPPQTVPEAVPPRASDTVWGATGPASRPEGNPSRPERPSASGPTASAPSAPAHPPATDARFTSATPAGDGADNGPTEPRSTTPSTPGSPKPPTAPATPTSPDHPAETTARLRPVPGAPSPRSQGARPLPPETPPRPLGPPPRASASRRRAVGSVGLTPQPGAGRPAAFEQPVGFDDRTAQPHPVGARSKPRLAAVAACLVLGLGLIGGAVTGSWITDAVGSGTGASDAQAVFTAAGDIWHNAPVDKLFPPRVKGDGAGPGGADRQWTRIGVAPDSGCADAFDPLLRKVLRPVGCERLLRATYTDATRSHVTTVGFLFTKADAATMGALRTRFAEEGLDRRPDLMPRPYAVKGTVAADFADEQRASWRISVLKDAPVVVYAVSGFADGRAIAEPEPAADAVKPGATSASAQAGLGHEAKGLADRLERGLRKKFTAASKETT
ncbi:hypothetical protein [Streptomyces sp. NPDC002851]